jgi:nitric-oxide synthase
MSDTMMESQKSLEVKAVNFLEQFFMETGRGEFMTNRIKEVTEEITSTGTWHPSTEELTFGAQIAWRNSNRCIGRIYWKTLKVIDARHLDKEEDILDAMQHHINFAFNNGDIRSTITIFRQRMPGENTGPRILNHQLIRFAGHREPDGSITGDPYECDLTDWFKSNGYTFKGTSFDVLPHAVEWPGRPRVMRDITLPEGMVFTIEHPEYAWFAEMGLQWYAVPIISDMMLEIGGLQFTAAPFNGWYMGTEIGSRNFGDSFRYNKLRSTAERMGLDCSHENTLWKDRAMVEINRAVLHTFEKRGVRIVNHHEAAEQFVQFELSEEKRGRNITADWVWINPPMTASATPIFHRLYDNTVLSPNFLYQPPVIGSHKQPSPPGCPFHAKM